MTKEPATTLARYARGARVEVDDVVETWVGRVLSVKWSRLSGWWYEVDAEDGTGAWNVKEESIR